VEASKTASMILTMTSMWNIIWKFKTTKLV